jgi:hypothetical protein
MNLSTIRKALLASFLAALAAVVTAYPDGFTDQEMATVVGAAVAAGYGVWKIKNEPEE